jgi:hypothetical protein
MTDQEQEQVEQALAELTQVWSYQDVTDIVKPYYLEGYDYLCTLQAPDGSPIYCRTSQQLFAVLAGARAKYGANESRVVPESIDAVSETLVEDRDGKVEE